MRTAKALIRLGGWWFCHEAAHMLAIVDPPCTLDSRLAALVDRLNILRHGILY